MSQEIVQRQLQLEQLALLGQHQRQRMPINFQYLLDLFMTFYQECKNSSALQREKVIADFVNLGKLIYLQKSNFLVLCTSIINTGVYVQLHH